MSVSWEDDPVVAVVKVGPERFMDELLQEGHVYMNTAAFFTECEQTDRRRDPHEGAVFCRHATGARLDVEIDGVFRPLGTLTGPIIHTSDELKAANVYCLHARRRSSYGEVFELVGLGLGEAAVLFNDFDEFIRRVKAAAAKEGHAVEWRLVEYVDRASYTGPIGIFRKFSDHAAQSELRLAIVPGTGSALSLRLGPLTDIAMKVPATGHFKLVPRFGPAA